MKFHYAKRLESFQAGIFAILNEKKEELIRQGRKSIICLWGRRISNRRPM